MVHVCRNCGIEFVPKSRSKNSGKFCTRKCAAIYHGSDKEIVNKRRQSLKVTYANLTEEQKKHRSQCLSLGHKNMSSESKLHKKQALRENWKNLPAKERAFRLRGILEGKGNFLKGQIPWNKGLTKETDIRVRQSGISIGKVKKGKPLSEKQIQANRIRKVGKKASVESKANYRRAARKRCLEDEEYWKNLHKSLNLKPNQQEKKLNQILQTLFPNEYEYVGDLSFIVGGKNPDFVNVNGQKKIVELYGDYWHRNDDPEERIQLFRNYGFETLVIWERELKNEPRLVSKLKRFHERSFF